MNGPGRFTLTVILVLNGGGHLQCDGHLGLFSSSVRPSWGRNVCEYKSKTAPYSAVPIQHKVSLYDTVTNY